MSQLRIHSINDLHFGKHQGVSFKDLNHDFVVFYGLNESGKSTIADHSLMIMYLVALTALLTKKN